ncbi:hypothetical protein LXA43DRAFT_872431, partial [Ganoderma leucocontextum]
DVDGIVDADMHALLTLADKIEDEERKTRLSLAQEEGLEGEMDNELEEDEDEDLSEEEREEFEWVHPVKIALVKIRKLAFKIVNSLTKLLPPWHVVTAELNLPNWLLPHDVRMRWNSTYNMLSESLIFRPAIDKMTDKE